MSAGASANPAVASPKRRPNKHQRSLLVVRDDQNSTVRIKQEPVDDIKDYAETTMNELLGWYGYDKLDSRDTQGLNLTHFAASTSPSTPEGSGPEDGTTRDAARPPLSTTPNSISCAGSPKSDESLNLPPNCILCAWCQKVGMKLFTLKSTTGSKAFCSELCFTQCRRASFKKNKVCDWCKHVRHTVNYVDFQDGEQQLQFCSDKCLNQYKMNIFCRETQAHLQMHPHLQEAACKMAAAGSLNLITPDLWLRDCKTFNSSTPTTNGHTSEGAVDEPDDLPIPPLSAAVTPSRPKTPVSTSVSNVPVNLSRTVHRAHHKERSDRCSRRHSRASRIGRESGDSIQSIPTHHHSTVRSPTSTSSTPQSTTSSGSAVNPVVPSLNGPSPAHLRTSPHTPPHQQPPPMGHGLPHLQPPNLGMNADGIRSPFFPHGMFPPPLNLMAQQHMENLMRMQHGMGIRPPGLGRLPLGPPGAGLPHPPFPGFVPPHQSPAPPPPPSSSLVPPVQVMVPYPIFLPVPIPIPIFLPLPKPKTGNKNASGITECPESSKPKSRKNPNRSTTDDLRHKDDPVAEDNSCLDLTSSAGNHHDSDHKPEHDNEDEEEDDMRLSIDTDEDGEDSSTLGTSDDSRLDLTSNRRITNFSSLHMKISKTASGLLESVPCSVNCKDKRPAEDTSSLDVLRRETKRKCINH